MSVDLFSRSNALKLLHNKQVWFFGDSNTRSQYKDLVWLLENGTMTPQASFKVKNEMTHANDYKTSNAPLTAGRDYVETREYYKAGTAVSFTFLTRVFAESLTRAFERKAGVTPDVVVFNSCVWDLSRWGPNGVAEYKKNVVRMLEYLKKRLSRDCLVIFTTTLPLSGDCRGGFLKKEVEFMRYQLPWHVIEANYFLAEMAKLYKYDVLDLHYYMRFLREEWSQDGIHWSPLGYRLITNLLLTHLALSFNAPLPGVYGIAENFVQKTQNTGEKRKEIEVVHTIEAKRPRLEPNLLLENKTKQANVVSEQTNQGDKLQTKPNLPQTEQLEVVASVATNQETKESVTSDLSSNNAIVETKLDLSQIKQPEVASNQDTKETVTLDLSSNNEIVETKPDLSLTKQPEVVTTNQETKETVTPTVSSNNEIVETKPDLSQIKQPEVVATNQETKQTVTNDLSSNNEFVETKPDLSLTKQPEVVASIATSQETNETVTPDLSSNNEILETKPDLSLTKQPEVVASIATNQETKETVAHIMSSNNEIVETKPDLSLTKQPEVVASIATSQETNETVTPDLSSNNEIVETKPDLSLTKQPEVVASIATNQKTKDTAIPDLSSNNEIVGLVDSECKHENNNNEDLNLNLNLQHSGPTDETRQLNDDDNPNIASVVANKQPFTTPNADLDSIKTVCICEPIKTNTLLGGECFNESTEAATVKTDSIPIKELFESQNHEDGVVETTDATVTCEPNLSPSCNSQESNDFATFLKESFRFAFFIESFSPQLEPLK